MCGFQFTQPFPISRKLFDSYGPLLFYGSIASYIVYIGFQLGGNFWLTVWTSDPQANTDPGVRDMYLGIYGLLGIFQVNSLLMKNLYLLSKFMNTLLSLKLYMEKKRLHMNSFRKYATTNF